MTSDKQREWRKGYVDNTLSDEWYEIVLKDNAGEKLIAVEKGEKLIGYIRGDSLEYEVISFRRLYKESFIEALLQQARREVALEIIQNIEALYGEQGDLIVDIIKDKYLTNKEEGR